MRSLLAFLLLLTFSFTALAQPYAQTMLSPSAIMEKYDYLLTSHPQAHEAEFKREKLLKYKQELTASLANSTEEEVKQSFESVVAKIAHAEKREAYLKILKNSTKQQLTDFMTAPALMSSALAGESANFSIITDEPLISITYIVMTGLILFVIINAIAKSNRPKYVSYPTTIENVTFCADYTFNQFVSTAEKENMKTDARMRCESESPRPDTCKFFGFLYNFERYSYTASNGDSFEGQEGSCTGVAAYRSKKEK